MQAAANVANKRARLERMVGFKVKFGLFGNRKNEML
jgi:hypothetical protein